MKALRAQVNNTSHRGDKLYDHTGWATLILPLDPPVCVDYN